MALRGIPKPINSIVTVASLSQTHFLVIARWGSNQNCGPQLINFPHLSPAHDRWVALTPHVASNRRILLKRYLTVQGIAQNLAQRSLEMSRVPGRDEEI